MVHEQTKRSSTDGIMQQYNKVLGVSKRSIGTIQGHYVVRRELWNLDHAINEGITAEMKKRRLYASHNLLPERHRYEIIQKQSFHYF